MSCQTYLWVASYPRSGSKLCRTILQSLFGAACYDIYASNRVKKKLVENILQTGGATAPQMSLAGQDISECGFVKTHELPVPGDENPALYVVRDARDSYVSYAHYAIGTMPKKDAAKTNHRTILEMMIKSKVHFSDWSTHVNAWTHREAPTAVVRYEDMVEDQAGAVAKALKEIGVEPPPPSGEMPDFDALRQRDPVNFRKGKTGSWREEMPPELEDLLWSIHGETMTAMGYSR